MVPMGLLLAKLFLLESSHQSLKCNNGALPLKTLAATYVWKVYLNLLWGRPLYMRFKSKI